MILKIIGQCDVKHILCMMLPIKTIVFNLSACIINSITARQFGLAVILALMSVSTLKTVIIQYLFIRMCLLATQTIINNYIEVDVKKQ